MRFFDSHAHICDTKFDEDRKKIIEKLLNSNISNFVEVGYNLESSIEAVKLSEEYDGIYSAIGISPNDIPQNIDIMWKEVEEIRELIKRKKEKQIKNKIVAIGEIGLDYYWNKENKEVQKELFIKQINIANEMKLPIVIHSRDAWVDTIKILKENKVQKTGIFHCCQLNLELIKNAIELDYYISLAGPITFKNVKNAKEILEIIPINRLLIETDSPYLSPEPNRGKRNDPRNVKYIAEKIAEIKGMDIDEIAKITTENTKKILGI